MAGIGALSVIGLALAQTPAPTWTPIESHTYAERQAALPSTKPASEAVLMLPFGSLAPTWSPQIVRAGKRIVPLPDPWRVVDRLLPYLQLHDEYLEKRRGPPADDLALVDWCLKSHLEACAEFECARCMDAIDDFQKPAYKPYLQRWLALRDRQQLDVSLPLPLEGEWFVLEDKSCHHRLKAFAAYAFDIVRRVDERLFKGKGTQAEDYFGFGQPIVAQAEGVVVEIDDHFPDNVPGTIGGFEAANSVVVDYGGGVLAMYGHLRKGSAHVKEGQHVQRGTPLADVGNSGASGMPHLHFTMTDWGYLSIRGRFTGEVRHKEGWVPFAGKDLEPGSYVRNRVQ